MENSTTSNRNWRRVLITWRGKKGARMPEDVALCARPSRYGNPFDWRELGRERAVELYKKHLDEMPREQREQLLFPLLNYRGLACYCRLDQLCHVDVIIEHLKNSQK